jgi:hypothetical protein
MRWDYPRLLEARPTEGTLVWLRWEDGLAAEVDLGRVVGGGPVFQPLRDPEYFRRIAIYPGGMTLHWPNEADIAPETLYEWTEKAARVAA